MDQLYPCIQGNARLRRLVEQSLASVIYHQKFLRDTMPTNHPLFQTELFIHEGFIDMLKKFVTTEAHGRVATGITSHTCLLKEMAEIKSEVGEIKGEVGEIKGEMAEMKGMIRKQEEQSRMPCQRCHHVGGDGDGTVTSVTGSTIVQPTSVRQGDRVGSVYDMFVSVSDKLDTIITRTEDSGMRRLVNREGENDVLGSSKGQVVSNARRSRNAITPSVPKFLPAVTRWSSW